MGFHLLRRAGYADSDIAALGRRLASDAPIPVGVEEIQLSHWMLKTREYLTVDSADVKAMLGAESPEVIAARLVQSRLDAPGRFARHRVAAFAVEGFTADEGDLPRVVIAGQQLSATVE